MSFKSIMIHMDLGRSNEGLLTFASSLTACLEAHAIGVVGCQPIQIPYDEAYYSGEILVEDRREIRREMEVAEEEFRAKLLGNAKSLSWSSDITFMPLSDFVAEQAKLADLIVTGPDIGPKIFDSTRRVALSDLVMKAGRPVLIVPQGCESFDLGHIVIGWKGTRESRRAIADALPLLRRAAKVTLLQIAPEAELKSAQAGISGVISWLAQHNVIANQRVVLADGPDSEQFANLAYEMPCDLIVAGAYGHSRFREWVLGGVTGDYLLHADRPVLVSH